MYWFTGISLVAFVLVAAIVIVSEALADLNDDPRHKPY